ncbi:hypothetical protein GCM10009574_058110 [Streptomyces asiaticus]|uniref:Transposase Helix-turn-helix domain-containing protein n=2 Tax=Streptomyces rhizosphaericus TaxID=114699 RepID=A0ABN1S4Q2_9ACTN
MGIGDIDGRAIEERGNLFRGLLHPANVARHAVGRPPDPWHDLVVAGVITVSESSWIATFTGLSPYCFGKLVTLARREIADERRRGRPWSLSLEDRVLLVVAYWRTNLTMRQLAPLFGISKSVADRIIDHLGPKLAFRPRKRFAKDAVLIADGTLAPTRDRTIAEQSKTSHVAGGSSRCSAARSIGGVKARSGSNSVRRCRQW